MGLFDFLRGGASAADEITHDELVEALKAKTCVLVDVREPQEFQSGRVAGSQNLPLSRFDPAQLPQDKPVVLICAAGARSARALSQARKHGRSDVRHYAGGVRGWAGAGGKLV